MTPIAGARLGSYEILALLGAGGMGQVFRARDTRLGREVAIKILPTAFTADADRRGKSVDKRTDIWAFGSVL